MTQLVDVLLEDDRWEGLGLAGLAEPAARAALAVLGLPVPGFSITLLGCDDARIAALNGDFRGKSRPTNVLSWPAAERGAARPGIAPEPPEPGPEAEPESLGDIAIAWETCVAEAREQDKALADHVTHLVVHAVLHLLGYDHMTEADADLMEGLEVRILASLGLCDPY